VRGSCIGSEGFHITFFEPSYQELDRCGGSEHFWLWAARKAQQIEQDFHNERFD